MELRSTLRRAARGMREEAGLHAVAISSLTIAFMCLGLALLLLSNLDSLATSWERAGRVTVFLRDGARGEDVQQLVLALEGVSGVSHVEHVTSAQAREQFVRDAQIGSALDGLPTDAFPASIEVSLAGGAEGVGSQQIADRVARFAIVEDVETYRSWFSQLQMLVSAGRLVAFGLAVLVLLCVIFVVGNTIRLAVAGRREEIEVMKLCGASDSFVRGPFVIEGMIQGFVGATLAVLMLLVAFVLLRTHIDSSVASLAGVRTVFLPPTAALAVILAGGVVGAMGSLVSLRRYLAV
jgi:cell division transport system permease protein